MLGIDFRSKMVVELKTEGLVQRFVVILLGVILAPIIYEQTTSANISGTAATILALIPTFFALAILVATIRELI